MASARAAAKAFKKLAGTTAVEGKFLVTCFTAGGFDSKRAIPDRASTDPAPDACAEPFPFVLTTWRIGAQRTSRFVVMLKSSATSHRILVSISFLPNA